MSLSCRRHLSLFRSLHRCLSTTPTATSTPPSASSLSPSPSASTSASSPSASVPLSASVLISAPLMRVAQRYWAQDWRFASLAQTGDLQAGLKRLAEEHMRNSPVTTDEAPRDDVLKRRRRPSSSRLTQIQKTQKKDDQTTSESEQKCNQLSTHEELLQKLSNVSYRSFARLMRTFASNGRVKECCTLLLWMHQIERERVKRETKTTPSQRKRQPAVYIDLHNKSNHKQFSGTKEPLEESENSLRPRGDLVAMAMTALSLSRVHAHSQHAHVLVQEPDSIDMADYMWIIDQQKLTHDPPNFEFLNALLVAHSFGKNGYRKWLSAIELLGGTVEMYTAAVKHFGLLLNNADAAVDIFLSMSSFFLPDQAAFNALIAVSSRKGEFTLVQRLIDDMRVQKQVPSAQTWAFLAEALAKGGRIVQAWQLYEWVRKVDRVKMEKRLDSRMKSDLHEAMIGIALEPRLNDEEQKEPAKVASRSWSEIEKVWKDLVDDRIEASKPTVTAYLNACLHLDHVKEARAALALLLGFHDLKSTLVALRVMSKSGDDYLTAKEAVKLYVDEATAQGRIVNSRVFVLLFSFLQPTNQSVDYFTELLWLMQSHLTLHIKPSQLFVHEWNARLRPLQTDEAKHLTKVLKQITWDEEPKHEKLQFIDNREK